MTAIDYIGVAIGMLCGLILMLATSIWILLL